MKILINNLISLILPLTVLILVPVWIEKNTSIKFISLLVLGIILIIFGLFIMTLTIWSFIKIGKGTLAAWNPTRKLVIAGMYRYVRNPMIIGVMLVLLGESIALLSFNIFVWAIIFFAIYNLYSFAIEEPNLKKKFSDDYIEYKRNVPRWIPRLKPYKPR